MAEELNAVCVLWTQCESCQWGCHYEKPADHTWMDDDDLEHARETGQTIPDPLPRCGCWCTGFWPRNGAPVSELDFARLSREASA